MLDHDELVMNYSMFWW